MKGSILVVGSGPAGMKASYELLQKGFKVYLCEEKPTIGGKMAQIDKMFPTNECATCTALPLMLELTNNPNLNVLAFTDIKNVEGSAGDFKVKLVKKPRYVNPLKCTACTDCFAVCPVSSVPMDFNFGRGSTKAIFFYSPFPPRKALINPEKCDYLLKGKCGEKEIPPCVEACQPDAIDFQQKPQEIEINVGAIVLAYGADELKDGLIKYGYGKYPHIFTSLEFERILSGLGPTAGVLKRDDGKIPKTITFILTDNTSPVYFMHLISEAWGSIEKHKDVNVFILHEHILFQKNSYENYYKKSIEAGVKFISVNSKDEIEVTGEKDGGINITFVKDDEKNIINTDMLILSSSLKVSLKSKKIEELFGFKKESMTVKTSKEGIYLCGTANSIMGIDDAIAQACSAASNCSEILYSVRGSETVVAPEKEFIPVNPKDEPSIAVVICECGLNIKGLLNMEELVKYTESLPYVKKVEVTPFGCDGIKIKELINTKKYNRIVMGACSPKTHEALFSMHSENAGLNRFLVEIVNIRNHCTWVHSKDRGEATEKAKNLMRMGVKRAQMLESLNDITIPIKQNCLVIGGNLSGISCALKLSNMGFLTFLVEDSLNFLKEIDTSNSLIKELLENFRNAKNIKVFEGAKIGNVKGFIGNYSVEILKTEGKEELEVGSIVIATNKDMRGPENDFEKNLALQRDEKNHFIPSLGILNIFDTNTDGTFICGSARKETIGFFDEIMEGEAVSSRVSNIIFKDRILKSPAISFVIDENCDGCAYCIEPCPSHALTLIEYLQNNSIKKTVEVNQAVCKGCGICMATCPKNGIFVRNFKPEYFNAMSETLNEIPTKKEEFKPVILTFCCNWCSYAAADAAGTARLQYPSDIHIVRAMCTGMIHSNMIMDPLIKGWADGVLVCGCHIGDCHYQEGNKKAQARADAIKLMLDDFGIEQERFRLEWVSASEASKFSKIAEEMSDTIKKLGPNPFRSK